VTPPRAAGPSAPMMSARNADPYRAFRFRVEIDGLTVAGFTEVSGVDSKIQPEEYREGGRNDVVHVFAGKADPSRLVFKRGLTDSKELWLWYAQALAGSIQRKSGAVTLVDDSGGESFRWEFQNAFPVKWSGPELRAEQSTIAIETFEIVHEGIRRGP